MNFMETEENYKGWLKVKIESSADSQLIGHDHFRFGYFNSQLQSTLSLSWLQSFMSRFQHNSVNLKVKQFLKM